MTKSLELMLSMNASVNIYVFSGGSAFGLMAGKLKKFVIVDAIRVGGIKERWYVAIHFEGVRSDVTLLGFKINFWCVPF